MKVDISSTFENFCLALQQTKHRVSGGALLHYARVAWEAHELNLAAESKDAALAAGL